MSNELIGQIVQHEGKIYQILRVNSNIVFAHSYGEDHNINETIIVGKDSGKVIAKKTSYKSERK